MLKVKAIICDRCGKEEANKKAFSIYLCEECRSFYNEKVKEEIDNLPF